MAAVVASVGITLGVSPANAGIPDADALRAQLSKERKAWDVKSSKFRRELRRARARAAYVSPLRGVLERIARCESGGDPRAVSAGGTYRGKYQFDHSTWRSVGGSGDPAAASEREQDYRAELLYRARGPQPWPVCG